MTRHHVNSDMNGNNLDLFNSIYNCSHWLIMYVSQCSIPMCFTCGGIGNDFFIANFPECVTRRILKVCQYSVSYHKKSEVYFFWLRVHIELNFRTTTISTTLRHTSRNGKFCNNVTKCYLLVMKHFMQHDNIHVMSVKNHNLICSNKRSKTNQIYPKYTQQQFKDNGS